MNDMQTHMQEGERAAQEALVLCVAKMINWFGFALIGTMMEADGLQADTTIHDIPPSQEQIDDAWASVRTYQRDLALLLAKQALLSGVPHATR